MARPWHLSSSLGFFATDLRFTADDRTFGASMFESLVAVGVTRDLGDWSVGLRVGAVLDGHVDAEGTRYDIRPGVVTALSVDWRALSAPLDPVSLAFSLQLGVSHTEVADDTTSASWTALDLRAAATVSRTFFDVLTPYFSARLFGGPVFWRDATGGDTTHVQLALGLGVAIGPSLSLHVEGAAISERGLFGGLALAF